MNIKFVEIKELCKLLTEVGKISFTYDSCLEDLWNDEPTGWFGIQLTEMFDGLCVVCGYYGGGDYTIHPAYTGDEEDLTEAVLYCLSNTTYQFNERVCVDMDEVEEKKVAR